MKSNERRYWWPYCRYCYCRLDFGNLAVKNWLGQDLQEGDLVYRGARSGDSSCYELGTVVELDQGSNKDKIRVEWFISTMSYAASANRPKAVKSRVSLQGPYALVKYDKSLLDIDELNIRPEDVQVAESLLQ